MAEDKSVVAQNDPDKCFSRQVSSGTSDPKAISRAGHQAQVDDLCLAIAEDREPMIVASSARKSVELILAIYESAQTGREVKLDGFVEAARAR